MCRFVIDKSTVEERHGIEFDRYFAPELKALEPLAEDGLVELPRDRVLVTPRGRFLVRNVAMAFDAYSRAQPTALYSRTV